MTELPIMCSHAVAKYKKIHLPSEFYRDHHRNITTQCLTGFITKWLSIYSLKILLLEQLFVGDNTLHKNITWTLYWQVFPWCVRSYVVHRSDPNIYICYSAVFFIPFLFDDMHVYIFLMFLIIVWGEGKWNKRLFKRKFLA